METVRKECQPPTSDGQALTEHFKQGRDDVRSYATLVFQILTLFLTSLTLVIGWGAKDFVQQQYDIALSVSAPGVYASLHPGPGPEPALNEKGMARELHSAGATFRRLVWRSPTTSALLMAFTFFLSLLIGVLVVLMYMLQRKRYLTHDLEKALGLASDIPLMDPVLTVKALGFLAKLVLVVVALIAALNLAQLALGSMPGEGPLAWVVFGILYSVVAAKLGCTALVARLYTVYDKTQGWNRRWPEAVARLTALNERLQDLAAHDAVPKSVVELAGELLDFSRQALDDEWDRKRIFDKEVRHRMRSLRTGVKSSPELWRQLRGPVSELATILRS